MNKLVYVILLLLSTKGFSQDEPEYKNITDYEIINLKINDLQTKNVDELVCLFDNPSRVIIAYRDVKDRFRAVTTCFRKASGNFKRKSISRKEKKLLSYILEKPSVVHKISNNKCYDNVNNSELKIIVIKNKEKFSNSFFTNCIQIEEVKPIKKLYAHWFI